MKCKDCKFLGERIVWHNPDTDDPEPTRFNLCDLIKRGPIKGPEPSFGFFRDGSPPSDVDAMAIDGSGYYAAFVVADDFGCVKFEPKE